jgi:hypothetical protein
MPTEVNNWISMPTEVHKPNIGIVKSYFIYLFILSAHT